MDPLDAIRATFFEECAELMESLEAGLLALQSGTQDTDTIDSVFRAVHSIKGGAGAFDLGVLVTFAHDFETTLDALRSGRLKADPPVIAVFLRSCDLLGDLIAASRAGEETTLPDTSDLKALHSALPAENSTGGDIGGFNPVMLDFGLDPITDPIAAAQESVSIAPGSLDDKVIPFATRERNLWTILFEPLPDLLASGNEPLFLFRALEVMGSLSVEVLDGDLPNLAAMDPQVPRLRWAITLAPSAPDLTETEIESVFEFAIDLCVLDIRSKDLASNDPASPEAALQLDASPIQAPLPAPFKGTSGDQATSVSTHTAPTSVPQKPTERADTEEKQARLAANRPQVSTTIRVDLARVDRLVNLVGELVISQSMLAQGMSRAGLDRHSEAVSTLDELQQLTRDMQDSVMSIRAQPVKSLFQRMTRIVRETGAATGKQVSLVTEGEDTEIDKTVVERLAEPLTHMIRNAIDHGLETTSGRSAANKPTVGIVRLTARQQSDRVVIEVSDDGRGVNREKVVQRAIERGLVPAGKSLDPSEIDRLLFMPGFSTNDEVSALSGRGVGMDVVQRAIRDLNGNISIASAPGEGCTISISLPLTLAILDGMIVRSDRQRMVIPLSAIIETQTLSAAKIEIIGTGRKVVRLHDRFVPLVDLAESMGFPKTEPGGYDEDAALVFVEPDESGAFALCVDEIEAQRQVVIKGLSENFGSVPCVSAATILGDGQVALIVDPAGVAALSGFQQRHSASGQRRKAS